VPFATLNCFGSCEAATFVPIKLITVPVAPLPSPEAFIVTVKFSARTGEKEISARTKISKRGMEKVFLRIYKTRY